MAIFYRGAGVGTHWHKNNAQLVGFTPQAPGMTPSVAQLMAHIGRGTTNSCYVSLTRSYEVAWAYAMIGKVIASPKNPGYVYQLEIPDEGPGCKIIDPVKEVATSLPEPFQGLTYHHDGAQSFLLGVVDPTGHRRSLTKLILQPPPGTGTPRPANLSIELEALVRALRDSEILAVGNIPASLVRGRSQVP